MGLALNLVSVLSVERRRRDKINNWIVTLSKIIPDCSVDSRTGAVSDSRVCKKNQTNHPPFISYCWCCAVNNAPCLWSARAKEASCTRPATTSGSCVRAISSCRRAARKWSGSRWTTSCYDSRLEWAATHTVQTHPDCNPCQPCVIAVFLMFIVPPQIEELKNDNALLRAQLQQHGVEINGDATPQ